MRINDTHARKCYILWRRWNTSKERHSRDRINEPFTHYILICATVLALSLNDDQSSELTFRFIYSLQGSLNRWEFARVSSLSHTSTLLDLTVSFRTSRSRRFLLHWFGTRRANSKIDFFSTRSFHKIISIFLRNTNWSMHYSITIIISARKKSRRKLG